MAQKTVDIRIVKTKTAVRKAFNEFVQVKDMSNISVSELARRAHITRSTFYMYYESVEAVRDEIENEIFEHVEKVMDEQDWLNCMVNPYPLLEALCKEIGKYDEYNRYILCSRNTGRLLDKMTDKVVQTFLKHVESQKIDIDASRAKYIAAFISAGTAECFKLWFNHKSSLTLEELCKRISEMISAGLASVKDFKFE